MVIIQSAAAWTQFMIVTNAFKALYNSLSIQLSLALHFYDIISNSPPLFADSRLVTSAVSNEWLTDPLEPK